MTARATSIASPTVMRLSFQYRPLPSDCFTRRRRRVEVMPDRDVWMTIEQMEDSGELLVGGVSKQQALRIGAAVALSHNASLTIHAHDADLTPAALRARRGR
ncbi:MAG: hypothetical protein IRZ09_04950 [Variibacter sp.]|nr:hypothetical protein [Variibacter sp.]